MPAASEYSSGSRTIWPAGDDGRCNWATYLNPTATADLGYNDRGLDSRVSEEEGDGFMNEGQIVAPVAPSPLAELAKPPVKLIAGLLKGLLLESCLDK